MAEPAVQNPDSHRFTLWQLITSCALVASAAASASWYIARARVDDELRQYERSKSWQLPELLRDLREVGAHSALQLRERRELETLRATVAQLKQQAQKSDELARRLKQYEDDTFEIRENQARIIVPGELSLGVKDIPPIASEVEVQFADRPHRISAGSTLRTIVNDREYRITLLDINTDTYTCKFKLVTVEKPGYGTTTFT